MTSVNQNFTLYSGDNANVSIGVTTSGVAASLVSSSAVWMIEENVGSGSVIRKTQDDDISLSGSIATITISPSDTQSLTGKYYHELEITDTDGNVSTVTTGIVTIKKSGAS